MPIEQIRWNDGSTWSKTFVWNGVRIVKDKNNMAIAVLNISKLSKPDALKRANELKAGMTGNVHITTPNPTVAAVGSLIQAGETAMTEAKTKDEAAQKATKDADTAFALIVEALTQWQAQVQKESGGDPDIIASTNMGVKAAPTPGGMLGQVQNLSVSQGDNPGELDVHWDPLEGRANYEIEICLADPAVEANWRLFTSCRKSSTTLTGLVSGTRVWVRVRAKAPKPEHDGPWSQPATKIVP